MRNLQFSFVSNGFYIRNHAYYVILQRATLKSAVGEFGTVTWQNGLCEHKQTKPVILVLRQFDTELVATQRAGIRFRPRGKKDGAKFEVNWHLDGRQTAQKAPIVKQLRFCYCCEISVQRIGVLVFVQKWDRIFGRCGIRGLAPSTFLHLMIQKTNVFQTLFLQLKLSRMDCVTWVYRDFVDYLKQWTLTATHGSGIMLIAIT